MSLSEIVNKYDRIVRDNSAMAALKDNIDDFDEFIEDLNFDSLSTVRMIADIEAEFGIEFDIDELFSDSMSAYGSLRECIIKKLEEKGK